MSGFGPFGEVRMTTLPSTVQERIPLPATPGPTSDGGAGVSVGDILGILKRRMVMLVLLSMLFGGMGVGAFFLAYIKFPTYRAEAWVECINYKPQEAQQLAQEALRKDEHERFINSEAGRMKNPEVLNAVLKTPEVRATSWYRNTKETERYLELEEDLGSSPIRDTNFVRVAINCRNMKDPAIIVDQVVKQYLDLIQTQAKDDYRDKLNSAKDQESRLSAELTEKLDQIRNFQASLPPGASLDRPGLQFEQLRVLNEQVAALKLQTDQLEGMSQLYNSPGGPGVTPEDQLQVEAHPNVQEMSSRLILLHQQLEIMLEDFGPAHRDVKQIQTAVNATTRELDDFRDAELERVLNYRSEQMRTAFLNSSHALMLAQDERSAAEAKQMDLDRKLNTLRMLYDEQESLKTEREDKLGFIRELERVVAGKRTIEVNIARRAQDPLERSSPSLVMLPAAIVLGVLLATGIVFLLEFTDTSVRTPQDVVRHLSVALLGTVPEIDDEEIPIEAAETAMRDAPHSMIAEAFRTIRTNLQFSAPADRQRSIMITSPKPEDGKTTIAVNLATAVAQSGRRVLLIDANFRRPALDGIFSLPNESGLSNILVGDSTFESCVHQTGIGNLDVLLTGPVPPNPAERLASPQLDEMLSAAIAKYDQVILDVPPVLLANDAVVLATKVDGAILVCRAKENSRGIARRACELLTHVNAHLFGAILNAAQTRRGGYFREQMSTFYDYKPEEILAEKAKHALPAKKKKRGKKEEDRDGDHPDDLGGEDDLPVDEEQNT